MTRLIGFVIIISVAPASFNLATAFFTGRSHFSTTITEKQGILSWNWLRRKLARIKLQRGVRLLPQLITITVALFVICPIALAQKTLNNTSVVKMINMGFSEDMIVNAIEHSPGAYDTSIDGLIALKNAGASNGIVAAVFRKIDQEVQPNASTSTQSPSSPSHALVPIAAHGPSVPVPAPTLAANPAPAPNFGPSPNITVQPAKHHGIWDTLGNILVPGAMEEIPGSSSYERKQAAIQQERDKNQGDKDRDRGKKPRDR